MRIKNKITIEGDMLKIFESVSYERRTELAKVAQEIWDELGSQFSGGSYENDDEMKKMLEKGITDEEEQREVFLALKNLADFEMNEGSFNPMKGEKRELNLEPIFKSRDKKGYMLYKSVENPNLIFAEKGGVLYDTDDMGNPTTSIRMSLFNVTGLVKEEISNNPVERFINAVELYRTAAQNQTHDAELSKIFRGSKLTSAFIFNSTKKYLSEDNYNQLVKMFGKEKVDNLVNTVLAVLEPSATNAINEAKEKKDPADKKKADKTNYGQKDIADVDMVNPYELKKGIRIEMESIEDYEKAMDKAVKKLKKDPMFYSNLIANAKETKGKRTDVPIEIKDKKLNKPSDKLKDKANDMEVSKKDATKKNANDSLNKKEKASGKPKGVKEMTMTPKKAKGMKSMDVPGKETKTKLKESFNLWEEFKKNLLK